jgi:hypothetical protein
MKSREERKTLHINAIRKAKRNTRASGREEVVSAGGKTFNKINERNNTYYTEMITNKDNIITRKQEDSLKKIADSKVIDTITKVTVIDYITDDDINVALKGSTEKIRDLLVDSGLMKKG